MTKTRFSNEEVTAVMEQYGITRKSAIRRMKKAAKAVNLIAEHKANTRKPPAKNASAVAKGAAHHVMAGRPSKDAVIACFGKSGYALSWVSRAERMGITAQELCEQFSRDAAQVKDQWAALATKKETAGAA